MGGGDQEEAEKQRKEEQKAKKKKKKKFKSQAASTDVADITPISGEESDKMDEKARKERTKGLPKDIPGRIVSISVVGNLSKILIAAHIKGLPAGTEGYIKRGSSGMLAKFRIALYDDRTAIAFVDLTPDMLHDHVSDIVINPTSMPKSSERRHDIATRVVGVSIVGGRTKILLGVGSSHGARDGMKGHLLDNGKPYEDFVVHKVSSLHCEAFVDTTLDDVQAHKSIMLNPS
jgi:hypothetical protein